MIKSLTSLIFFIFFCSILAATLNGENPTQVKFKTAENILTPGHHLAFYDDRF